MSISSATSPYSRTISSSTSTARTSWCFCTSKRLAAPHLANILSKTLTWNPHACAEEDLVAKKAKSQKNITGPKGSSSVTVFVRTLLPLLPIGSFPGTALDGNVDCIRTGPNWLNVSTPIWTVSREGLPVEGGTFTSPSCVILWTDICLNSDTCNVEPRGKLPLTIAMDVRPPECKYLLVMMTLSMPIGPEWL